MKNRTMKISNFGRHAFGVCAAIVMLSGCSGSPVPINPSSAMTTHRDRGNSWMAPDAGNQDLLYISDLSTYDVYVYSYPKGKLEGRLTGFGGPEGECVDKTGHVFIANFSASNILEYAHGGASPVATLSDPGYYPVGCSV